MSDLVVRAYNVLFGDAILVTIPEADRKTGAETERHILIDVGSVLSPTGADNRVYQPVVRDIIRRLAGKPLDLYVMTHEHLDHVKGLFYARHRHGITLNVECAWLTASAEGDAYYGRHAEARRKRLALETAFRRSHLRLREQRGVAPTLLAMLRNNDRVSTSESVRYLRSLAKRTFYVYRGAKTARHPFKEAKLRILAPEQDTSAYYGRVRAPVNVGRSDLRPLPGVDPKAFRRLIRRWREGVVESIFAIDQAANNTSVVLEVEWRGWRLLFPGDAEQRSWSLMNAKRQLRPVDFLKVAHHGSHTGTPGDHILDRILPQQRRPRTPRFVLVSGCAGTYSGVPDAHTLGRLRARCDRIFQTRSAPPGTPVEIRFPG